MTSSILIPSKEIWQVLSGAVFEKLIVVTEDDDSDVYTSEHTELMRLLEKTSFALKKCDAPISIILNGLYLNLATTHGGDGDNDVACKVLLYRNCVRLNLLSDTRMDQECDRVESPKQVTRWAFVCDSSSE
jgi:hypothetical protein